jgi:hypothetical protein
VSITFSPSCRKEARGEVRHFWNQHNAHLRRKEHKRAEMKKQLALDEARDQDGGDAAAEEQEEEEEEEAGEEGEEGEEEE